MPSIFHTSFQSLLYILIIRLIVALTALPVHECAHAYAAMRMGDHTAERQGRLTLNPFAHFDPIGTTAIILFGFGWAKPVPINPLNFNNPKKGMMLSALAGPLSNIGLAFLSMVFYKLVPLLSYIGVGASFVSTLSTFFYYAMTINISLGVFNLIPIPPLDGSRIVSAFLPSGARMRYNMIERYGTLIMLLLCVVPIGGTTVISRILNTPVSFLTDLIYSLAGLGF